MTLLTLLTLGPGEVGVLPPRQRARRPGSKDRVETLWPTRQGALSGQAAGDKPRPNPGRWSGGPCSVSSVNSVTAVPALQEAWDGSGPLSRGPGR
jgi:hypothetical protein